MNIKKIGIFTSGGDAPGMNAVTRAVTRYAISKDINVTGIRRGYMGLRTGDAFDMNLTIRFIVFRRHCDIFLWTLYLCYAIKKAKLI